MFRQPKKSYDATLELLAKAYKCYEYAQWDYVQSDAGAGGFLVDRCIVKAEYLSSTALLIGEGLRDENINAKQASLLFDKLYKHGFKGGMYKDEIQDRFKEILPPQSIERLNTGEAEMEDCIKALCIYIHTPSGPR